MRVAGTLGSFSHPDVYPLLFLYIVFNTLLKRTSPSLLILSDLKTLYQPSCVIPLMPIPSSTTSPFPNVLDDYDRPSKKHLQPTSSPSSLGTETPAPLVKRQQKRQRSLLSTRPNRDAWVNLSDHRIRNSQLGNLHAGSRFTGTQKCGDNKYDVVVDIQVNGYTDGIRRVPSKQRFF